MRIAAVVGGLPAAGGVPVVIRKEPAFWMERDSLFTVIVAPDRNLAESVADLQFANNAHLVYDVYVGTCAPDEFDLAILSRRLDFREQVRLALWVPFALGLESLGEFDVDYEPAAAGTTKGTKNLDESWQRFRFKFSTARSTP